MQRGRRNKRQEEPEEGGMERWLLSYADFITLLMVFFILMYALSKVDVAKYNAIAKSLSVVLTGTSISPPDKQGASVIEGETAQELEEMNKDIIDKVQLEAVQKQIEEFIKAEQAIKPDQNEESTYTKLGDYIEIIEQERGLVVSIKDTLLFPSASNELNPQARLIIKQVGSALGMVPNHILVEGHTDNLPINTVKFPSNWELSVLRACNVMHVFQEEAGIAPERLSAVGYGEYRPRVPNLNPTNRAINRRVDIVILKKKYDGFDSNVVHPGNNPTQP